MPSYDADPDLGKDPDSNKGGCKNVHNVNNEILKNKLQNRKSELKFLEFRLYQTGS